MLAKTNRLRDKSTISFLFRKGKRIKGTFFSLIYFPNNKSSFQTVVLIAKKVAKKATRRNRLKRLIVQSIREIDQQEKLPKVNFIVRILSDPGEMDYTQVKENLAPCLKKIS